MPNTGPSQTSTYKRDAIAHQREFIKEAGGERGKIDPSRFSSLPWRKCPDISDEIAGMVLAIVAGGKSLQTTCRQLRIDVLSVMKKRFDDPTFNEAYEQALELRAYAMEDKAFQLGVEGIEVEVTKGSGEFATTTTRTEFPTAALLQFLLKAQYPEKYGIERKEIKAGPLETGPETIKGDEDRERLRQRIADRITARQQAQQIAAASEVIIDATVVDDGSDLL